MLLSTCYKARIPSTLSYPLGAEIISRELAGWPNTATLSLCFYSQDREPDSAFTAAIRDRLPTTVVELRFEPGGKRPGIGILSSPDDIWSVTIYPVSRVDRHAARAAIVESGFHVMRDWLHRSERPGWHMSSRRIARWFDPKGPSLVSSEQPP